MIPITFTITSCNRLDLLEKTLDSFMLINNYEIDEYLMSDDSGNYETSEFLNKKYGEKFKIISNNLRVGLSKSIDNLFISSKNEYIFHCEDDWLFDSNPNLIADSVSILSERNDIHQVSVRHNYCNPHKSIGGLLKTKNNVEIDQLRTIRDTCEMREDILARQMAKDNRTRYEPKWNL